MIDLHMHILPGVDDGAESPEEGLEMARIAAASGVRAVAATSHGDFSYLEPEKYLKLYNRKIKEFRRSLAEHQIPLTVYCGMELMVNDSLLEQAGKRPLPGINGGRYLLTEFLFDVPARLALSSLKKLQEAGYKIILAHPERYDFAKSRPELLEEFFREGIILQVNKGSIPGNFGKRAARTADWLLGRGMAGLVASDAHDTVLRTPDLADTARVLDLYYGADASRILLERNPVRILRG
ncbi:MAG TPA: hypothetical protein H9738_13540 [Candidatus Blautia pullistercoris]|uniref:protein-tyrosine-phosphatase n=1 Tax=Candidatus Blautia pullistercoris TaxID=2838499 RepID=A0A9D1VNV7_9FIRM|nr:hypothetical protein [Candidatus Blautia pullistercoris]